MHRQCKDAECSEWVQGVLGLCSECALHDRRIQPRYGLQQVLTFPSSHLEHARVTTDTGLSWAGL
eukprot:3504431-Rhodomonas_salina.2